MDLDEIIYAAITADAALTALVGSRVKSTCVEVPPMDEDNTPLPYIVITDDPFANNMATKDSVWEGDEDRVQASVVISAASPHEVKQLRRMVRKAVMNYVAAMESGRPYLEALTNDGIAWDWEKPCYYDTLHYQCDTYVDLTTDYDEQEN